MVNVYRNVWERSAAKNIHPVNLLSVVSKIFEKLVNNRLFNHREKWCLFMTFKFQVLSVNCRPSYSYI